MVNEVFDVSAEFNTCRQVIVESGVTRPYLDLILGKFAPNTHTPIFGDPKYAWLTPLSTYGRCFGKCLSADSISMMRLLVSRDRSRRKIKLREKDAPPAEIKRKIVFSDLRNPPNNFTPLFGEVAKYRTLTEKDEQ